MKEDKAIRAKCLAIIEKTRSLLAQFDHWHFPTDCSEKARSLLVRVFDAISDPTNLEPMDPVVLYNKIFLLREHTELLRASTTNHISWPLVNYCDKIWNRLFGDNGPSIFYSLTPEHNYSILRFSSQLKHYVSDLLPTQVIDAIFDGEEIYCLQLASSEDYNLPLYANIGHEFGHALFDMKRSDIVAAMRPSLEPFLVRMGEKLRDLDAAEASRRYRRGLFATLGMAEELFCDLLGGLLMGPAFFLSLYEISWGQSRNNWSISLSPSESNIRAYPSFDARLLLLKTSAQIPEFCTAAKADAEIFKNDRLKRVAAFLVEVPHNQIPAKVNVRPRSDGDAEAIQSVFADDVALLKSSLYGAVAACEGLAKKWGQIESPCVRSSMVAELLQRLENFIIPNIVQDGSLLGKPASFASILNASSLYRLNLLADDGAAPHDLGRESSMIERLTAKALEVSFIQTAFKAWEKAKDERTK